MHHESWFTAVGRVRRQSTTHAATQHHACMPHRGCPLVHTSKQTPVLSLPLGAWVGNRGVSLPLGAWVCVFFPHFFVVFFFHQCTMAYCLYGISLTHRAPMALSPCPYGPITAYSRALTVPLWPYHCLLTCTHRAPMALSLLTHHALSREHSVESTRSVSYA